MTTPSDPLALLRSRSYVALLVLAAIIGVPVSAAAYFFLALVSKMQGWIFTRCSKAKRQGLDLGLAAAQVALIAFLGQEQEAFEVAAAVVDDAVDLPGGLVAAFAAAVVAAGLVRRAPFAPQGEGWIVQYWNTCPPPTARKTTASPRPTITSSGVGRRLCLQMAGRLRPPGARPQTVPPHIFSTPPANPSR